VETKVYETMESEIVSIDGYFLCSLYLVNVDGELKKFLVKAVVSCRLGPAARDIPLL
jgi:hypothetical protein